MELLKFDKVNLVYHTVSAQTNALKDVSFSIGEDEFVAIIGPSGCGKTTVLSLVAGLIKPSSGKILLENKPLTKPSSEIGYMLQRDQLFPWRTIEQNIFLGLEVQKLNTKQNRNHALSMLAKYGLDKFTKHFPRQLSGGMRQRVALIRTLAFNPKILLLDEPFSALDYQTRLNVGEDIHNIIKSEKKTAVLVSHDLSEAISLADRIIVLSPRPGTVKNIYDIDIKGSPLSRREHPKFSYWFDKIWKEIQI